MEQQTETMQNRNYENREIPAPGGPAAPKVRQFTTLESVFAWMCLLAGYVFCRVGSVTRHPFGGFLFVLVLFAVSAVILKLKGVRFTVLPVLTAVSAVIVSAALFICGNSAIHFWAYVFALVMYIVFVFTSTGNTAEKGFSDLWAADFFKAAFIMPFFSFAHIFSALFSGRAKKGGTFLLKLLLGVVFTIIPTIAVLVLLSYDASFTALLKNIFSFTLWDILSHIGSMFLGVPIAMYLFGLFISCCDKKCSAIMTADQCRSASRSIKIAPGVTVAAAVLPLLGIYLLFFISQWQYYMSGFSGVLPENFNYAEYARDGFFQLCTVSVINFAVIACISLFMSRERKKSVILLRTLSVVLAVFTLVLISTAAAKMIMYINCYGLTPKRVYASWLMGVLAILFILIIVKQFVTRLKLLSASLCVCVICFAGLALSGTDALIAKYNVDRYLEETLETIDIAAMESLGDSAVPHMVRLAEALDEKNGTDISKFTPEKNTYDALYSDLAVRLYKAAGKQKEDIFSLTLPRLKAAAALEKAGITAR